MENAIIIPGKKISPNQVELAEALPDDVTDIQVIARRSARGTVGSLLEFIKSLPPGNRTKEDIDAQIREERDEWGDQ